MVRKSNRSEPQLIEILLVDDDEGDILLAQRALENGKLYNRMHTAKDGVEAMDFLKRRGLHANATRPDLVLLDLNMPRKDGREVLSEMKQDAELRTIPVVILTTSDAERDIVQMYNLHANCYVTKPVDLEQFTKIVREIKQFWFSVVQLPSL